MHASNPQEYDGRKDDAGDHLPSRMAAGKVLLMACGVSFLLALVALPLYQNHHAKWSIQQTIFIGETRTRELGIQLTEITHQDGHVEVSDEALLTDQKGTFIFAEDYALKHRFLRASVTAVPLGNGRSRIVYGLFPGDRIVVKGAARLRCEPDATPRFVGTNCS